MGWYDDDPQERAWDFEMSLPAGLVAAEVIQDYRDAIAASDDVLAEISDPEQVTVRPVGTEPRTLRWVLAHLTSETARHAGHADILREQIDGVTGR
jgi:hypothetical protein